MSLFLFLTCFFHSNTTNISHPRLAGHISFQCGFTCDAIEPCLPQNI
jgi:hypothetical protein